MEGRRGAARLVPLIKDSLSGYFYPRGDDSVRVITRTAEAGTTPRPVSHRGRQTASWAQILAEGRVNISSDVNQAASCQSGL